MTPRPDLNSPHRKWTAVIVLDPDGSNPRTEPALLDAEDAHPKWGRCPDLMRETAQAAAQQAARALREGRAEEAEVRLLKQLARWPEPREERIRSLRLWREGSRIMAQH